MPTLVAGSRSYWGQTPISLRCIAPHPTGEPKARRIWTLTPITSGGFTLLELLVVIVIMAVATAGVGLAMRGSEPERSVRVVTDGVKPFSVQPGVALITQ